MTSRQSGHGVLIAAVVIIVVVIVGLLGWIFWQNFSHSAGSSVTNFEQCKAATGSKILETYPEQCVTTDGRSFTGPLGDTVSDVTYCTEAEKLCFEYRDNWTIEKFTIEGAEPGSKTDLIEVSSPEKEVVLTFESGIGGLGGACPDESKVPVTVLTAVPIVGLTGYEDEFSVDTLRVARVYYPVDDKYAAVVYATGSNEYTTPGMLNVCGIGFSEFINGKNSVLSSDFEGAGVFRFGIFGNKGNSTFDTEAEAKAAFDSDVYRQAVSLLSSLHYE